jgi:DNA-binding NtrC family response regulator
MKRPRLLCVDDDPGIREFYEALFGTHGYDVKLAGNGRQALNIMRVHPVDAVLTDYDMPDMNGPELAAEVKRSHPSLPVIMVSGSRPVVEEAPHFVDAALAKGAPVRQILDEIEALLATARSRVSWTRYVPLGEALAAVVGAALVFQRVWK